MKNNETETVSELLSEPMLQMGQMEALVVAYVLADDTIHFGYTGGRLACRGLAEELRDFMVGERSQDTEMEEA